MCVLNCMHAKHQTPEVYVIISSVDIFRLDFIVHFLLILLILINYSIFLMNIRVFTRNKVASMATFDAFNEGVQLMDTQIAHAMALNFLLIA